jgi:hypothetical protein
MKNQAIYFKYGTILIIFVVLLLLFRGCICNKKKEIKSEVEIVTTHDTLWRESKIDTVYKPVPVSVIKPKTITIHDTLETSEYIAVDTAAILRDYYSTANYSDTQHITQGTIVINDAVTKNRIASRNLITNLLIPEVTKTITITEKYPRRVVFFVGGELAGNKTYPIWGVGASAGLQFKNLKTYSVGYMINQDGNPLYSFRFAIPIRLTKR